MRRSRLRHRSKTNSRYWEDLELRQRYREEHPWCAGLTHPRQRDGEHVHHIMHAFHRWDLWSNLLHLCCECHEFCHRFPVDGTLLCLQWKVRHGEMDAEEFFTAAGKRIEGYVDIACPSQAAAVAAKGFLMEWSNVGE